MDEQEKIEVQNTSQVKLEDRAQVQENKQVNIAEGRYIHRNLLGETERSQHQKDVNLGNVRKTVLANMPAAYDHINDIQQGKADADVALHNARGTKLYEQGENVLEFDIGGSGYKEFQQKQVKLGGKGNFYGDVIGKGIKVSLQDIKKNYDRYMKEHKLLSVRWYNKLLYWTKLFKSEDEINQLNELTQHYPDIYIDYVNKYGINPDEDELNGLKHILVKFKAKDRSDNGARVWKQRVTMAGPLGGIMGIKKGMRNAGDYSTKKLREYTLVLGKSYCEDIFTMWDRYMAKADEYEAQGKPEEAAKERAKINNINIIMRGHSRGGVAVTQGAMMIKYWLHEKYPQYEKYVKFETTQYDPVPGTGSEEILGEKQNLEINLNGDAKEEEYLAKKHMRALGDSGNTTVVYSLHTQHALFFAPQIVKGAKRIILTPFNHDVGIDKVDKTQNKAHRSGYTDSATGEVYRGSGISQLDEGLYILDEKNVLVKMPDAKTAEKIVNELLKKTSITQYSRHDRIRKIIRAWFEDRQ